MANYVENFTKKLDWAMPFQRTGKFPLDRTDLFSSYADAVKYAKGDTEDPDSRGLCGTSYVGQVITVFENDTVTCYKIEADRTLGPIGSASYAGDDKSIVLVDGVLKLKGFAEAIEAGNYNGKQPRINASGELEWVLPDTQTVEGLGTTVEGLKSDVNTLTQSVNNLKDSKVDKVEGKGLSTNDYTTEDKSKLGGIENGAQVNVLESVKVNGVAQEITAKGIDISVPTKVSDLTNDSNFINNTVSNLVNYYTKTETYSKNEVDDLLAAISILDVLVVDELPTEDISKTTIYLVKKADETSSDIYDEYIYVTSTGKFEKIGNTTIDLTNYLQKNGDASNTTIVFTEAGVRELPGTGETLSIIIGKIVKYLTDLKPVAFTGSYNDLTDKPAEFRTYIGNITTADTSVSMGPYEATRVVSVTVVDSVTGEQVLCDVSIKGSGGTWTVTVSTSVEPTNQLDVIVTTYTVA